MATPITMGLTTVGFRRQRPIIIDGLNIGYSHGGHKRFSAKGLLICVQYFVQRGFYFLKIMMPQHYRGKPGTETHSIIKKLMDDGYIYFTPSRKVQNIRLTCYSDRIMLDYAIQYGGVVVSNDNFRDLFNEHVGYQEIICQRHIMFMFVDDIIIFPNDQYSKTYPSLYAQKILFFPA